MVLIYTSTQLIQSVQYHQNRLLAQLSLDIDRFHASYFKFKLFSGSMNVSLLLEPYWIESWRGLLV